MKATFRYCSVVVFAALTPSTCSDPGGGGTGGTGGTVPGACSTDADCRTFSDYCTGCDCRALSVKDPDPVCPGPGVQCFVDPCMDKSAVCRSGQCALADGTSELKWFTTCGDPVCRGYTPQAGVPLCTAEQVAGAPCKVKDEVCDPKSDCNELLRCTDTDPAVVCPISSRRFKTDIEYVDQRGLEELAKAVNQVKLAQYRYKGGSPERTHLGFIIEDQPESPAVQRERDRVDLYGYTSMAIAALQVQTQQLQMMQKEIGVLKQEVRKAKAKCVKSD